MRKSGKKGIHSAVRASRGVFAEPLEERVLMALAKAAGGSGTSCNLSTNPTIRQQQLICDPASSLVTAAADDPGSAPLSGSTSVSYDARVVSLIDVGAGPGYDNESFQVLVEVTQAPIILLAAFSETSIGAAAEPPGTFLIPFAQFDEQRFSYVETGYVQIKFQLAGDPGQLPLADGFQQNDRAGVFGADTHELFFRPQVVGEGEFNFTGVSYTSFAAGENTHSGNSEDFFIAADGTRIGHDQISPAVATTNPIAGKPTANLSAPVQTGNGPVSVTLSATDPSAADSAAGFTYQLDWGDGSPLLTVPATANNGAGVVATHDYASGGLYTITLTTVDQHHEVSDPVSTQANVVGASGAELRVDPSDPSKLALYACGSSGDDVIRFAKVGEGLKVTINGDTFGPFYGFGRVIACGGAGNDDIRMDALSTYSVLFFGNEGDDVLVAGNGPSILSGGSGIDRVVGGNGKDLLIGGAGKDTVAGGNGEDILVAGRTSYDEGTDADVVALTSILNEWSSGGQYETRIDHITATQPGGLNSAGTFRLSGPNQNVFDDGASDTLSGGNGRDWILSGAGDQTDLAKNETGSVLQV